MGASGVERMDAFITIWGNHIPHIQGVARALMLMQDSDAEAAAAWDNRMTAVRRLCKRCIDSLREDGRLATGYTPKQAGDFLFMLVSVPNWITLVRDSGWSQKTYVAQIQETARRMLVV